MNDLPPASIKPRSFWKRFALPGKIIGIVLLALLQLIPLFMVEGLLEDRLSRRDDATREITSTWGSNQQVLGPVLIVPYRYYYTEKKQVQSHDQTTFVETEVSQDDVAFFLPAHLKIDGQATPKRLHRGIYQAVVYDATLDMSGDFAPPNFAAFKLTKFTVFWNQATLAIPIHDLRGVQQELRVHFGDQDLALLPGSTLKFYPQGLHAEMEPAQSPPNAKTLTAPGVPTAPVPFHLRVDVRGSDNLQFAPLGVENVFHLTSPWPDPSFNGPFPPAERKVTPDGFDATWRISYYGRNFPQQWRDSDGLFKNDDLTASYFGVEFISMIDSYRSTERSIKYGIVFIALVFVTFFLFEILTRLKVHLIQYTLVSAALVLFYLVLLSLSEFISFGLSYLVGAALSILLISGYCARILGGARRAFGITAGLATVYAALYVILQLEDYALLVGTVVLVGALALVMYVTRKVNWYGDEEETAV